jgi:hypothetical protein
MNRPPTYDSSLSVGGACIQSYGGHPLVFLPKLGALVRLLTGGPAMIVVDVPVCLDSEEGDNEKPPFGAPIGVVYVDESGHVSSCVVPFGTLQKG